MTIDNDIMRMTQEDMVDEIMTLRLQRKALVEVLKEARLQTVYLGEKFKPTGTSQSVLTRINAVLDRIEKGEP